jgi:hypothetical protein
VADELGVRQDWVIDAVNGHFQPGEVSAFRFAIALKAQQEVSVLFSCRSDVGRMMRQASWRVPVVPFNDAEGEDGALCPCGWCCPKWCHAVVDFEV